MRVFSLIAVLAALTLSVAFAQDAEISEANIKARSNEISKTLRCVVCQNQSIYDSNAPLAQDMRRLVEDRVRAGDSDDEVREYLRGPYGDFILMKPPFQMSTLLLWLGPFLLAFFGLVWFVRKSSNAKGVIGVRSVSASDKARIQEALSAEEDASTSEAGE